MATGLLRRRQRRGDKTHTAGVPASFAASRQQPAQSAAAAAPPRDAGAGSGPARYFADHPVAYGLSLAGSGGTALYTLAVAARLGHRRRAIWLALGTHCAAQFVGIVAATELTRRRVHAGRHAQHGR